MVPPLSFAEAVLQHPPSIEKQKEKETKPLGVIKEKLMVNPSFPFPPSIVLGSFCFTDCMQGLVLLSIVGT